MWFLYLLVGTAGLVALVPMVVRAFSGQPLVRVRYGTNIEAGLAGGATAFGAIGLVAPRFSSNLWLSLIVSVALGAALGGLGAELLASRGQGDRA